MLCLFKTFSLASSIALLLGCAGTPPDVRVESTSAAAIGLSVGQAIVVHADTMPDSVPTSANSLTLIEAITRTAHNSPEIQAAFARVRIAQAEANQARLLPNPVLNLAVRIPEGNKGKPVIEAGLAADLLAILRQPGAIKTADSRLRAAAAEAVTVVLDEVSKSQEHYIALQAAESAVAVMKERQALIDRLVNLAVSKLQIGEGTRLDLITLQTQRIELQSELAEKELELRDERLALARLMGEPLSDANWSVEAISSNQPEPLAEALLVTLALEHRPEISQRRWELEAYGFEQQTTRAWLFDGSEAGVEAERDGDWTIGPAISLPLPLFDMGQAQRQQAMARVIEARHQLTAARRTAIEDVRRAHTTLRLTRSNLNLVAGELLPLQQERLKQAEAQFRAGQSDVGALLLAEQDLRATQSQLIELQRKSRIALVRLERAAGGAGIIQSATAQITTQNGGNP